MAASKRSFSCLLLMAYMYADQTSKLLVIFLCRLICICDCYTKCFSGKTVRQLFGSHLLCCFLSTYVFLDVLSLKTLTMRGYRLLYICRSGLESLTVWNVPRLIAPPLPNGQPLIRGGRGGESYKYMNNNQIKSKSVCVFCRTWLNTTWLTVSCHSIPATQIQDYG